MGGRGRKREMVVHLASTHEYPGSNSHSTMLHIFSFFLIRFAGLYQWLRAKVCTYLPSKLSNSSCLAFDKIVTNPIAGHKINEPKISERERERGCLSGWEFKIMCN